MRRATSMTRWWRRCSSPIRSWVPRAGWSWDMAMAVAFLPA
ncbi:hypothetical protein ACFQY5_21635 [Paeniroseomonas aquatica]